ncbi:MAG: PPE family protein [Mycobacteriaceae bacterium]|nr:PPE family protein [Mycobacteriaceae bacterium]
MSPPGGWGADPPEYNSAGFWLGPGAASFMAGAGELSALAAAIIGMLGGHQAVAAALNTSWPAPTGNLAVLANVPHLLWQAKLAMMLEEAAIMITATAEAFETLRAATPTPGEIGENQIEHVALQQANVPAFGMLTPLIAANRARYTEMWIRSATNKYAYAAASEAGIGSIPPIEPPTPTAMPVGGSPGAPTSLAGKDSLTAAADPQAAMSTLMPMMSQLGQLGSQAGQLGSGGGGLAGLPQQALSPLMSLSSQFGSLSPPGADAGSASSWLTATPAAGGPVSASLAAGGGGGGGGVGAMSSAMSPLRGPVSWNSATVNASTPAGAEAASAPKIADARAAATAPAGSAGMGSPGAMMGPMAHGAGGEQDKREKTDSAAPLTAAAALYRAPSGLPVITGGSGAVFPSGEGADDHKP